MRFTTKRGRPKTTVSKVDLGTPELQRKRKARATLESMDWCLKHELITLSEQWAGNHLYWLHTLKYGAVTYRTVDFSGGGSAPKEQDPEWLAKRMAEYDEVVALLEARGVKREVFVVSVYKTLPVWCKKANAKPLERGAEYKAFLLGLRLLSSHWGA